MIKISKIISDKNMNKNLTTDFNKKKKKKEIWTVFTLTETIRSKISNLKKNLKRHYILSGVP